MTKDTAPDLRALATPRTDVEFLQAKVLHGAVYGPRMVRFAQTLERELTAANARAVEAERDAGRYRWLRTEHIGYWQVLKWFGQPICKFESVYGENLDAAIDAALSTKGV